MRGEVTGDWKRVRNEELYNFYSSTDIIRMTKLKMRWAGHVAGMGGRHVHEKVLWESLKEKDQYEELGVDGGIILKWS
jgi:hypothetical protein